LKYVTPILPVILCVVLTDIITKVLLMLLSQDIKIAHRPKDTDLVKRASDSALKRYKEMSGRETEVEYEDSLNDDSPGGIVGSAMAGRIKVDNTLGERLKILEEKVSLTTRFYSVLTRWQMLPELRHDLFGVNESRKFYTVSSP
jgi:V-type H+-transporting ATPase subunit E